MSVFSVNRNALLALLSMLLLWVFPRITTMIAVIVVGPSLVRAVVIYCRKWYARWFRTSFPLRRIEPFPLDVESIFFAGNGSDVSQSMRVYGVFPHSARVLANPIHGLMAVEPADIWVTPLLKIHAWWRINLAQELDVTTATAHVREVLARTPSKRLVLFGSSRGAAVVLQVAAQLTEKEIKRIPMIVCEAPFTTVEDVIDTRFAGMRHLQSVVRAALRWLTLYRNKHNAAWSPLAAAITFPHKTLPIVLVRSLADKIVVPRLTELIGNILRGVDVKNVHEIVLKHSSHSDFTSDHDEDRRHYVEELNRLYKRYL